jgi:hypothetical protein
MALKKPKPRAGEARRRATEDLTTSLREKGAKVRMRIVLDVDVDEDDFGRDDFNEHVVEAANRLEDELGGTVVLLTTEEIVQP